MGDSLAWCRERMLVPGQPLSASLLFIPEPDRAAILALRTVCAELTEAARRVSDPLVASAKLSWWRQTLSGRYAHPAVAALESTGAAQRLPDGVFQPLLDGLQATVEPARFERFEELWDYCGAGYGRAAEVEFSLNERSAEGADGMAMELGSAGGLLRVVRDLVPEARQNRWLVPLDLQAQFQVARMDALGDRVGPGWDGLVRTLVERALRRGDEAASRLGPGHRHLVIHWAVDRRLARVLLQRPRDALKTRILPGHAGNVWAAWRAARRLQRRGGAH
ncbi:MAG: hypothetical protein EA419_05335 [Wenzhouxiangella sp.]|nr:MAG: hypothetical protein EA419_05335 [Wenzhouxiangella sp.]